jgi:hypothetical protein
MVRLRRENDCVFWSTSGLPDFSRYNIPKTEKLPNDHKMYQMVLKYTILRKIDKTDKKYQHLPLQDLAKFTQIGIFGFENIPSGNTSACL